MDTAAQIGHQWQNPADILSLLLLIGGETIQRAIAQLFGIYLQPFSNGPRFYFTPVAFSFGWVGYAFTSLASVLGDKQLMPSEPDSPCKVINCSNGYGRRNRSWLLGRLLRDHELTVENNPGAAVGNAIAAGQGVSLRIDIFTIQQSGEPDIDNVWLTGWAIIVLQLGISIIPWLLSGNWGIFLITAAGTALALLTGCLRQWEVEKWPGPKLNGPGGVRNKTKDVCLLRGNGNRDAMILLGSGSAWDIEKMATATSKSLAETPWLLGGLTVLWTCLLITVSGLEKDTWFLLAIGGLGMLQNIYASAAKRNPAALDFHVIPNVPRRTIVGLSFDLPLDDENSDEDTNDATEQWRVAEDLNSTPGVRGAIRELEKDFPKFGIALMQEFFPALVKYEPARYRTNKEKKFWKKAFREIGQPV